MNPLRAGSSFIGIVLVVSLVLLLGCRSALPPPEASQIDLIVSIPPQAYFVERIGGDAVTVTTMMPAGAEPHSYEPQPDQLQAISRADAYLRIRIDFEAAWMDRLVAANPAMQVVDITEGLERLPLPSDLEGPTDQPAAPDPHVWLSPRRVKIMALTIAQLLSQLDPARADQFQDNLVQFQRDIDQLDGTIRRTLADVVPRRFLVFHPAWGYFARDYDLQMLAVAVGGQAPSAAELARLIRLARQEQIRVVFTSPQFSQRDAQIMAREIGGEVQPIDPVAYDWLENLQQVAATFAAVLPQSASPPASIHKCGPNGDPGKGLAPWQGRGQPPDS